MGKNTRQAHIKIYWRAGKDIELRTRLEQDVRRGKGSASAICRRALAQYYGLERPTPADNARPLDALTTAIQQQTQALREQHLDLVAQVAQLRAELVRLAETSARATAQIAALQAENQQLRQWLLAATFGDRTAKRDAERAALAIVGRTGGNGNGHE